LQFSPAFGGEYELFATDSENANNLPDNIATHLFSPDFFTMTFAFVGNSWAITIAPLTQRPMTWTHPVASSIGTSYNSWIYKQETSIAQNATPQFPNGAIMDGTYFGVDASGNPLFAWQPIANFDSYPDPTRAIQSGNSYGINLHP